MHRRRHFTDSTKWRHVYGPSRFRGQASPCSRKDRQYGMGDQWGDSKRIFSLSEVLSYPRIIDNALPLFAIKYEEVRNLEPSFYSTCDTLTRPESASRMTKNDPSVPT